MSTCISNLDYDPASGTLTLTFPGPGGHGGSGVYEYYDVPVFEAAGLTEAGSQGEYFNQNIRDHYAFERISGYEQTVRDYQSTIAAQIRKATGR